MDGRKGIRSFGALLLCYKYYIREPSNLLRNFVRFVLVIHLKDKTNDRLVSEKLNI